MTQQEIKDLRREYIAEALDAEHIAKDPIAQFRHWFEEALQAEVLEPNAMTLATCGKSGQPSARIVLLKGYDQKGFVFFTNYESRKGQDLEENPKASLVFSWLELARQIRIEGEVEKIDPQESTRYFQSRPKGSQIGAWASPQSQVISSRKFLEEREQELSLNYQNTEVLPRPPHWGGYILRPWAMEFWQGRPSRLHDRFLFQLDDNGKWQIDRLAP